MFLVGCIFAIMEPKNYDNTKLGNKEVKKIEYRMIKKIKIQNRKICYMDKDGEELYILFQLNDKRKEA